MEPQGDLTLEIIKLVFAVVAPILSAFLVAMAAKGLAKMGLTLDAEKQAKLEYLVTQLVAQTEEWASAKVKAGIPITAQQKAEYYLSIAADKLPGVTAEEAHALAQAVLGRMRLAAAGVVQDVRVAATQGAK